MTKLKSSESARASGDRAALGRLFVLELSGNRVFSVNPDGSDRKVIVNECRMPDGIAVDVERGHIYWTNMGVPNLNDGSIERADLDGRNRKTIVPQGGTFTPKQLQLDKQNGKLYWCDREGMRVMRANLDGSDIETLVETGQGDSTAATRRGGASASPSMPGADRSTGRKKARMTRDWAASSAPIIEIPAGQSASNRTDIEVLFDGLPEPIDLELDLKNRLLYWTDRGDPPRGNTVNRAPMDADSKGRRGRPRRLCSRT